MHASDGDNAEVPGFVRIRRGRACAWVRRGLEGDVERLGLAGTPEADAGWAAGGRRAHPIVRLQDGGRAVVRAYLRGGALRHLNRDRYFAGQRALAELRATLRARAAGVRVPEPLAATERQERFGYTARFATRWVEGARDAAALLADAAPDARAALWREAGRQIGRMHAGGVAHPDLNLRNLLAADTDGRPEVYLLDFDRARLFAGPVPEPRRGRDLRRLARSVRKLASRWGAAEAEALRDGYGSGWPPGLRLP